MSNRDPRNERQFHFEQREAFERVLGGQATQRLVRRPSQRRGLVAAIKRLVGLR